MNRPKYLPWTLGTIALAALVSYAVVHFTLRSYEEENSALSTGSSRNLHQWLHDNLGITHEQEAELLPIEERFEEQRVQLCTEIADAGKRLAEAIRDFDPDSSEVTSARSDLNRAQGDLQQITLDHFFAMKDYLSPNQGAKLLEWTRQSILHGYDE